jgi:uncharacterized protein YkwD
MARRQRLTHTGSDGSSPAARMRDASDHPGYIAENILTCRYIHAGVGVASGRGGPWWTLDLATGY